MSEHLLVGRAVGRGAGRTLARAGSGIVPRRAVRPAHRVTGGLVGALHLWTGTAGVPVFRLLVLRRRPAQQGDGTGHGRGAEPAGAGAEPAGDLVGTPLAVDAEALEGVGDGAARGVGLDLGVRRGGQPDGDLARDAGQPDVRGALRIEV